jgi:hypothetical protein
MINAIFLFDVWADQRSSSCDRPMEAAARIDVTMHIYSE